MLRKSKARGMSCRSRQCLLIVLNFALRGLFGSEFKLSSVEEMREFREGIWAKFATPANEEEVTQVLEMKHPAAVRVSSNGSLLRRIIQRQSLGSPAARRRDWKQASFGRCVNDRRWK